MNVLALLKNHKQDNRLIRRLTMKGYQVIPASDTNEALNALQGNTIHSIVMDAELADRAFLKHVRQLDGAEYIYVFALAAGRKLSPTEKDFLGYVDEYLARPFEPDELIARLMVMERYQKTLVALRARQVSIEPIRDALTGTFSQTAIMELLETELQRSRRSGKPFTLALFSLENA